MCIVHNWENKMDWNKNYQIKCYIRLYYEQISIILKQILDKNNNRGYIFCIKIPPNKYNEDILFLYSKRKKNNNFEILFKNS